MIYTDERKLQLEKRIAEIKRQMIEDGELVPTEQDLDNMDEGKIKQEAEEAIRGSFIEGTSHLLNKRIKDGSADRLQKIVRICIFLAAAVAIVFVLKRWGINIF
ncbi:hypothetical protein [Falsiporphyromonas endometrii]|uniref:Uncharacterized protein n=1 Tax=Falsiporphyromonas endometrii TaxID=1387297 RepID=A0ABV9K9A4_9PORP